MRITHDKETDCKYIGFQESRRGAVARTEKCAEWLLVDYAHDGSLYGVEILNASEHQGVLMTIANEIMYVVPNSSAEENKLQAPTIEGVAKYQPYSDYVYA